MEAQKVALVRLVALFYAVFDTVRRNILLDRMNLRFGVNCKAL